MTLGDVQELAPFVSSFFLDYIVLKTEKVRIVFKFLNMNQKYVNMYNYFNIWKYVFSKI